MDAKCEFVNGEINAENNDTAFRVHRCGIPLSIGLIDGYDSSTLPELFAIRLITLQPNHLILLGRDHCLYEGHYCPEMKYGKQLIFNLLRFDVIDVQYYVKEQCIYILTTDGAVYYCGSNKFSKKFQCCPIDSTNNCDNSENEYYQWERLLFDAYNNALKDEVRIKKMAFSLDGVIFISDVDCIYAFGNCSPYLPLHNKQPKLIHIFNHSTSAILDLVAGDHYFAFLILDKSTNCLQESHTTENDIENGIDVIDDSEYIHFYHKILQIYLNI